MFEEDLGYMKDSVGKYAVARLSSPEPDLDLESKMNRLGQIQGTFTIESERIDGIPTVPSGSFKMDQTFLPTLRDQAQVLLKSLKG